MTNNKRTGGKRRSPGNAAPRRRALKRVASIAAGAGSTQSNKVNIEQSVESLLPKLPEMSYPQLVGIWRNAVHLLEGKQGGAAMRAIKAIEREWQRRGALGVDPNEYFAWPTTEAPGGDGQLELKSLPSVGMLKYLEYQVGRTNGQSPVVRRAILKRVFEGSLPPLFPPTYMAEWGKQGSTARLQKMAETIAALTRLFRRRHDDRFDDAIADWEADLAFLYDEYYVGRFRFAWPLTRI